jgi:hypothetical protein
VPDRRFDQRAYLFRPESFRVWAGETTAYHREVVEAALAHTVRDKVEAALRRDDLLEKRTEMMGAWGRWCALRSHIDLQLYIAGQVNSNPQASRVSHYFTG